MNKYYCESGSQTDLILKNFNDYINKKLYNIENELKILLVVKDDIDTFISICDKFTKLLLYINACNCFNISHINNKVLNLIININKIYNVKYINYYDYPKVNVINDLLNSISNSYNNIYKVGNYFTNIFGNISLSSTILIVTFTAILKLINVNYIEKILIDNKYIYYVSSLLSSLNKTNNNDNYNINLYDTSLIDDKDMEIINNIKDKNDISINSYDIKKKLIYLLELFYNNYFISINFTRYIDFSNINKFNHRLDDYYMNVSSSNFKKFETYNSFGYSKLIKFLIENEYLYFNSIVAGVIYRIINEIIYYVNNQINLHLVKELICALGNFLIDKDKKYYLNSYADACIFDTHTLVYTIDPITFKGFRENNIKTSFDFDLLNIAPISEYDNPINLEIEFKFDIALEFYNILKDFNDIKYITKVIENYKIINLFTEIDYNYNLYKNKYAYKLVYKKTNSKSYIKKLLENQKLTLIENRIIDIQPIKLASSRQIKPYSVVQNTHDVFINFLVSYNIDKNDDIIKKIIDFNYFLIDLCYSSEDENKNEEDKFEAYLEFGLKEINKIESNIKIENNNFIEKNFDFINEIPKDILIDINKAILKLPKDTRNIFIIFFMAIKAIIFKSGYNKDNFINKIKQIIKVIFSTELKSSFIFIDENVQNITNYIYMLDKVQKNELNKYDKDIDCFSLNMISKLNNIIKDIYKSYNNTLDIVNIKILTEIIEKLNYPIKIKKNIDSYHFKDEYNKFYISYIDNNLNFDNIYYNFNKNIILIYSKYIESYIKFIDYYLKMVYNNQNIFKLKINSIVKLYINIFKFFEDEKYNTLININEYDRKKLIEKLFTNDDNNKNNIEYINSNRFNINTFVLNLKSKDISLFNHNMYRLLLNTTYINNKILLDNIEIDKIAIDKKNFINLDKNIQVIKFIALDKRLNISSVIYDSENSINELNDDKHVDFTEGVNGKQFIIFKRNINESIKNDDLKFDKNTLYIDFIKILNILNIIEIYMYNLSTQNSNVFGLIYNMLIYNKYNDDKILKIILTSFNILKSYENNDNITKEQFIVFNNEKIKIMQYYIKNLLKLIDYILNIKLKFIIDDKNDYEIINNNTSSDDTGIIKNIISIKNEIKNNINILCYSIYTLNINPLYYSLNKIAYYDTKINNLINKKILS